MCVWGKLLLSRNPQHSRREFCKIHSFLDLTVPQITDTKQIILWMSSSTCDEWWNKEMTNSRVIHGNVDLELSPDWEAKEGRGPLVEALPVPPRADPEEGSRAAGGCRGSGWRPASVLARAGRRAPAGRAGTSRMKTVPVPGEEVVPLAAHRK